MNDFQARRILVVDDNPSIHDDFRKILTSDDTQDGDVDQRSRLLFGEGPVLHHETFHLDCAFQGQEGVEMIRAALEEQEPYHVAFVDIRMPPGWDGVETILRIRDIDPNIQLVLCSAYSDYTVEEILQRFGASDRLLMLRKPFDVAEASLLALTLSEKWYLTIEAEDMLNSMTDHVRGVERVVDLVKSSYDDLQSEHTDLKERSHKLSERLQEQSVAILGTQAVAVFALAQLAESRDPETGEHLLRMRAYSQLLAEELSEHVEYAEEISGDFLENFYQSTPLHDIGKVGIPDRILLKPGPLSTSEFQIMKRHTLIGALALERAASQGVHGAFLNMAAEIARCHHERCDGTGYPIGLKGNDIPLAARIVSVADVFDALTMKRVYKDAIDVIEARDYIAQRGETQFDPDVVKAFVNRFEEIVEIKRAIDCNSSSLSILKEAEILSESVERV
jgi:putative two-component system response regulator